MSIIAINISAIIILVSGLLGMFIYDMIENIRNKKTFNHKG
jgi:hypothetical protein